MSRSVLFAIDLAAITIVVFGLYFPRHRRKDLVVAFLGVNIGVLAVADALNASAINAGLGLGLFGVLSIIRLRSTELDQEEVAYYFAALALGLLGGLTVGPDWLTPALMAAIVAALFIGDHPRLFAGYDTQIINLDRAFTDEPMLRLHLEHLLDARVHRVKVRKVDLVNDTTNVEVRFQRVGAGRSDLAVGMPTGAEMVR
jgi:hypothetical protein